MIVNIDKSGMLGPAVSLCSAFEFDVYWHPGYSLSFFCKKVFPVYQLLLRKKKVLRNVTFVIVCSAFHIRRKTQIHGVLISLKTQISLKHKSLRSFKDI